MESEGCIVNPRKVYWVTPSRSTREQLRIFVLIGFEEGKTSYVPEVILLAPTSEAIFSKALHALFYLSSRSQLGPNNMRFFSPV